jgi:PIN domain
VTRNFKLPSYVLYFDTNVAYSKKPSEPISNKLVKAIQQGRALTSIDVRVPEVVVEELIYQQFVIAEAASENLTKNSKTLLDVCSLDIATIPLGTALEAGARQKLTKALAGTSITTLATPVSDIDWKAVIRDSCWRKPPFEKPRSADDLAEKGFRDRIILETIKHDVSNLKSGTVAFVAHDNLLRTTFETDVKTERPSEVYANLDEFIGQLELLEKTRSTEFAAEVVAKAAKIFYDSSDPNCVALSKGVIQHLLSEYDEEMSRPPLFSLGPPTSSPSPRGMWMPTQQYLSSPTSSPNWLEEWSNWAPVTPIKLFAAPPVFHAEQKDERYHWTNTVTLARLLRRNQSPRGQAYLAPEERIRTKEVKVEWSCKVDPVTADFTQTSVDDYAPTFHDSFINADTFTRSTYDMPLFPGMPDETDPS